MAKKSSVSSQPAGLTVMSSHDIKTRQWTDRERSALRKASHAQATRGDAGLNLADIPSLTGKQLSHLTRLRETRRKVPVSVRLDPQVLEWLRAKGEGHLTRINDILANLMEAERKIR
jgi:uncharacterized protein (DUF4415 family)